MIILVVDDEEIIRNMLKEVLQSRGHTVYVAGSGYEALEILKEKKKCDLVLSDVHMPGMNGYELLKNIKEFFPDIPILMMDSFPEELSEMCIKGGALKCIHKPFDLKELSQAIKLVEGNSGDVIE